MACVVGHSPLSLPAQAYCYSPQARRSYDFRALSGDRYGPGTSAFLDELEVWNIAFLTSAFESQDHILDIEIALCAYKTGHFVLSQQSVDEVDLASPELCVGGLFRLPPLAAVAAVRALPFLEKLPLYQLLGPQWVDTMTSRIAMCRPDPRPCNQANGANMPDVFSEANAVIRRITSL